MEFEFRHKGKIFVSHAISGGCDGCAFMGSPDCWDTPNCDNCIFVEKPMPPLPKIDGMHETVADIIRGCVDAGDAGGKLVPASQAVRKPDPTNPKDLVGSTKLPVGLVPDTVTVYAAMAFKEGASKYGAFNWRAAPVRFSIYMEAMSRHQLKLFNGEWADKKTRVPHLASIIACAGIIADAKLYGTLIDDRPPAVDYEQLIADAEEVCKHVALMHAHMDPKHWTIADIGMKP